VPRTCPKCGHLLRASGWLVEVHEAEGVARRGDAEIALPPTEAAVLACLAAGNTVSAVSIHDALYWDRGGEEMSPKNVPIHIHRLRFKLPALGLAIKTIWGIGYRLTVAA
jgi:DNA-binding response OmpR family regulator